MKLVRFTFLVAIALLVLGVPYATAAERVGTSAEPASDSTIDPPACAVNSWSPELFSFYGDRATLLAKFQALDRNLLNHRTFAFIVQTNRGAKLTFFELQGKLTEGTMMDLASTKGASFNTLSNQITTALLDNTGKKCAGMLTKELVSSYTMDHSLVARPATAGEAFRLALAEADGEYMQAT